VDLLAATFLDALDQSARIQVIQVDASQEPKRRAGSGGMTNANTHSWICGVTAEAMRQRLSRARALLARRLADTQAPGLAALREVTT